MNKKIKNSVSIIILIIIVSISALLIYSNSGGDDFQETASFSKPAFHKQNKVVSTSDVILSTTTNYSYLFESTYREPNTSNIVGYFGGGAFAWYVPDWLVNHWKIDEIKDDPDNSGMIIRPTIPIANSTISNIVVTIKKSTEIFNAETLFESMKKTPLIISEVFLNKHTEGGIKMVIETNTRIYHIQSEDKNRMQDWYLIDGNDQTMLISFSSDKENFQQYSTKIRDFVEGIGEIKVPQG